MPTSVGPNIAGDSNLVFGYDIGDISNSYLGQPTTNNFGNSFRNFTGTSYSFGGEWTSNPTQFIKTYFPNLPTPIGPGATLIEESGSNGYHHLSSYGGGGETGLNTISCYLYPLTGSITNFTIGLLADGGSMVTFNLDTRQITYGAGIANRNAILQDVPGWPGWLRAGANIEGRAGGWVGCLGYSTNTTYTGTSGSRKCYVTGIQYEYQNNVTQFTGGTRSVSGSLIDLSGRNTTINVSSLAYDSLANPIFTGSAEMHPTIPWSYLSSSACEAVFSTSTVSGFKTILGYAHNEGYSAPTIGAMYLNGSTLNASVITATQVYRTVGASTSISTNQFYHVVLNKDTNTGILSLYVNGAFNGSQSFDSASYGQWPTVGNYIGSNMLDIGKSSNTNVGQGWSTSGLSGSLPVAKVYNRLLTPQEIYNNYNEYKTRFNLT